MEVANSAQLGTISGTVMMQTGEAPLIFPVSPSFSSYSSGRSFAVIAARVVDEFMKESDSDPDFFAWKPDSAFSLLHGFEPNESIQEPQRDCNGGTETFVGENRDDDFEFAVVPRDSQEVTIAAEDAFYNGHIRPIYPVFDANLLLNDSIEDKNSNETKPKRVHRPSLGKLMSEDREANSCSSSEADELDGVNPETFCVWKPKESLERCKKSNSMGSSKRWKLRDLLNRSHSDGKDAFVFLAQSKRVEKITEVPKSVDEKTPGKLKSNRVAASAVDSC